MKFFIVALSIFLSGCYVEDSDKPASSDCQGYGCNYDAVTELGIRFRNDQDRPYVSPTSEEIDVAYRAVSACFGVWYEPHGMLVISTEDLPPGYIGMYFPPGLVLAKYKHVIGHEFVHHMLYVTTGDLDAGHASAMFRACGS